MLRHLTSLCIVLCLSTATTRAQDQAVLPDDKIPPEVRQLEGKVVKIYHDVDLLGAGKASHLHTEYLTIVLRQAGVTVQHSRSLDGEKKKKEEKPADVVIFGDMQPPPQLAPGEAADPFVAKKMRNIQLQFDKYVEARPKLEAAAAAAGARVIKSEDVPAVLGIRVAEPEMVEALDERARQWLKREVPVFKAEAISLSDIIDFLRDVSEANIFVNWRTLEAAGIDRKAPLTLRLEKLSLSEALDELLAQAAGGDEGKLGYIVKEGVIVISTASDVKKLEQQSGR